jgi:hypothetical protein
MQNQTDRRRPLLVRTDVLLHAKLLREHAPDVDARVRNLSPAGFMAECSAPLEADTEVIVSLPGIGSLPAQVRWSEGLRIGGIFHFELSTRELGLIRATSAPEEASEDSEASAA